MHSDVDYVAGAEDLTKENIICDIIWLSCCSILAMKRVLIIMCNVLFMACQPREQSTAINTKSAKPDSVTAVKDTLVETETAVTTDPIIFIKQKVECDS